MAKDYDPFMHTVEHILNQTMVNTFGCGRCFSSHLNAKKSKCDYHFWRDLTEQEATDLAAAVNAVIAQNLPVTEEFLPFEQAKELVNLSKLPEDADISQPIRLIRIGNYDVCPCIGGHVAHTAEVGSFRLISHSYTAPAEGELEGVLRLRFALVKA